MLDVLVAQPPTYVWNSFVTIYTMLQSTRIYNLFPRKTVINNFDKLWHIS